MLLFNQEVFDDITDSTTGIQSSDEYNELLGRADAVLVMVYPTLVSGTSPTLTLAFDQSNDNQHWLQSANLISGASLVNNQILWGSVTGPPSQTAFGRLRFSLGGTSPQAQLKITVVGRSY